MNPSDTWLHAIEKLFSPVPLKMSITYWWAITATVRSEAGVRQTLWAVTQWGAELNLTHFRFIGSNGGRWAGEAWQQKGGEQESRERNDGTARAHLTSGDYFEQVHKLLQICSRSTEVHVHVWMELLFGNRSLLTLSKPYFDDVLKCKKIFRNDKSFFLF